MEGTKKGGMALSIRLCLGSLSHQFLPPRIGIYWSFEFHPGLSLFTLSLLLYRKDQKGGMVLSIRLHLDYTAAKFEHIMLKKGKESALSASEIQTHRPRFLNRG